MKSQTIQKPCRSEHSNAHADKIKKRRTVANSVLERAGIGTAALALP